MTRDVHERDDRDDSAFDDDEDALQWAGDEELGRDSTSGVADLGVAANEPGVDSDDAPPRPSRLPFVIALAVAIASAVAWGFVIADNPVSQESLLALAFYQLGEFLAVVAPILGAIVVQRIVELTAKQRLLWWGAAAVVTAPWPLLLGALA